MTTVLPVVRVVERPIIDEIRARDLPSQNVGTSIDTASAQVSLSPHKALRENLWRLISEQQSFSKQHHPNIVKELRQLQKHPEYFQKIHKNAYYYLHFIYSAIKQRQLPAELALLPIVESAYEPFAYSQGKAAGLWQFMSATGKELGLAQNWWVDDRRDIQRSTHAALDYLTLLNKRYKGDWLLTLAAYNAGIGTVHRAIKKNKARNQATDFWSLDLPKETKRYVPKLLAVAQYLAIPEQLEKIPNIGNEAVFTDITLEKPIDLAIAADFAQIDIRLLYQLNPAYRRWTTPLKGTYQLLIPVGAKETFLARLAQHPDDQWISFTQHTIQKGETLTHIAKQYHVSVNMITQTNQLADHRIRQGAQLRIPVPSQTMAHYVLADTQRRGQRKKHAKKLYYTVKRGDSLWRIATHHGVNIKSLLAWNNIDRQQVLQPGKTLTILPAALKEKRPLNYTVRAGDSLARISKKFSVSISSLRRWNAIRKGKYIYPGQQLTVYLNI